MVLQKTIKRRVGTEEECAASPKTGTPLFQVENGVYTTFLGQSNHFFLFFGPR
jgi:hypothetical protein